MEHTKYLIALFLRYQLTRWKGKDARYEIRRSWCGDWIISVSHSGKHHITLCAHWKDASSIDSPPENGWNVMGAGILPVPSCRIKL